MTIGTNVELTTRSGSSANPLRPESTTFIVVQAQRGPSRTPIKVRSPQEYFGVFGDQPAEGFGSDFVAAHFGLGGSQVVVVRQVGASATAGNRVLKNRVSPTAQDAVRLNAVGEGSYSSDISVTIADGTVTNSVTVTVSYKDGQGGIRDEIYRNIGLNAAGAVDLQTFVDAVNDRPSKIVTAAYLAPATSTGATARLALGTFALSAGANDIADTTEMTDALASIPSDLGPGMVAVPGYLHTDIATAVKTHCAATKRSAILGCGFQESQSSIEDAAETLDGTVDGKTIGIIAPWIKVASGGSTKWIEPTAYATAMRSRTSERVGVWQEPAGLFGADENGYVLGLATVFNQADNSELEGKGVSAICRVAGQVRLMGWRNLGGDPEFPDMTDTDEENAVAWGIKLLLDNETFLPLDSGGLTVGKCEGLARGFLKTRAIAGAYFAGANDPGYAVSGVAIPDESRAVITAAFRRRKALKEIDLQVVAVAINAAV